MATFSSYNCCLKQAFLPLIKQSVSGQMLNIISEEVTTIWLGLQEEEDLFF